MDDRRLILEEMERVAKANGLEVISKVIPFTNKDVLEFLEKLDKSERYSRSINLVARNYC